MADRNWNQNQNHHDPNYSTTNYSRGVPVANFSAPMNRQPQIISPTPLRISVSYQQYAEDIRFPTRPRNQHQPRIGVRCEGCQVCAEEPRFAGHRRYSAVYDEVPAENTAPAANEGIRPQFAGNGWYAQPDPRQSQYYPNYTFNRAPEYAPAATSTPRPRFSYPVGSPTSPLIGGSSPAAAPASPTSPFASPRAQYWGSPRSIQGAPTTHSLQPGGFVGGGNHGFYPAPSVERELPAYVYGSSAQPRFLPRVHTPDMYRPRQTVEHEKSPDLYSASPPHHTSHREESPDLYTASPPRATLQHEESPDLYGASPPRQTVKREESLDLYSASPPHRALRPNGLPLSALLRDNDDFYLPSPAVQAPAVQAGDSYNTWSQYTTFAEEPGSSSLRNTTEQGGIGDDEYFKTTGEALEYGVPLPQSWDEEIKEEDVKEEDVKEEDIKQEDIKEEHIEEEEIKQETIEKEEATQDAPSPSLSAISEESLDSFSDDTSSSEDDLSESRAARSPLPLYRGTGEPPAHWATYQREREGLENRIQRLKTRNRELKNRKRELKERNIRIRANVRHLEMQYARLEAEQNPDELHMQGQIIHLERDLILQRREAERVGREYEQQTQELQATRIRMRQDEAEHERLRARIRDLEMDRSADRLQERLEQETRMRSDIEEVFTATARRETAQRADIARLRTEVWTLRDENRRMKRRWEEMEEEERYREERRRTLGNQMGFLSLETLRRQEEMEEMMHMLREQSSGEFDGVMHGPGSHQTGPRKD